MQTKAIIASLILAATSIHAAPALEARQVTSVPLNIYEGAGCNSGPVISTTNVPTDGSCFPVSPIISGNTDSARIDLAGSLPRGCTLTLFNTPNCNPSGNNVPITGTGQCRTFGTGNPISNFIQGARTSGTCT
ncbi:hypothetical protein P154DRAFT_624565 [Amniculicola lignicola CBS 123094]|uniref:Uncharacterized protein n=1 Tax=Amniculicola lignicola CBS 123094 TaxID=1392246 RepID=A0A6A5VY70_9PLEO|nr:hypothetical protein P154DRAFT_624565 [Amniculicola lignicola CBS 123094]